MSRTVFSIVAVAAILAIIGLSILAIVAYMLHSTGILFGMVGLPRGERIAEYPSPDGQWTLAIYRVGGNATVDFSIRGKMTDNSSGNSRNIYWSYHESEAEVVWLDGDTVEINGVILNARSGKYDWRRR